MDKLAELMLNGGVLTKAQLESVLQKQRVFGGSLALNLLIEGAVSERVVQVFLEQVVGNPGKQPYDAEPDPDVLGVLDRDRAARLKCIPIRREGDVLHVLTIDPGNTEAMQEIEKRSGCNVVPSLVNEMRFLWLLDRWYGIVCPQRAEKAARELYKGKSPVMSSILDSNDVDSLIYDPMAGATTGMTGLDKLYDGVDGDGELMEVEEEMIPILEEELDLLVKDSPEEEKAALRKQAERGDLEVGQDLEPLDFEGVESALSAADSLDDVFEVFERYGGPFFKALAAFRVQGGVIMGWRAVGKGINGEDMRGIVIPVSGDGFLVESLGEKPILSSNRETDADREMAARIGCGEEGKLICHRIIVLTRPVMVLCATLKDDVSSAEVFTEFGELCEKASSAVVRIIMKKKKSSKKTGKGRGKGSKRRAK